MQRLYESLLGARAPRAPRRRAGACSGWSSLLVWLAVQPALDSVLPDRRPRSPSRWLSASALWLSTPYLLLGRRDPLPRSSPRERAPDGGRADPGRLRLGDRRCRRSSPPPRIRVRHDRRRLRAARLADRGLDGRDGVRGRRGRSWPARAGGPAPTEMSSRPVAPLTMAAMESGSLAAARRTARPPRPTPRRDASRPCAAILRVVITVVVSAFALYLVYLLRTPIGWLFLATFVAVSVSAPVNRLSTRMPRGLRGRDRLPGPDPRPDRDRRDPGSARGRGGRATSSTSSRPTSTT